MNFLQPTVNKKLLKRVTTSIQFQNIKNKDYKNKPIFFGKGIGDSKITSLLSWRADQHWLFL